MDTHVVQVACLPSPLPREDRAATSTAARLGLKPPHQWTLHKIASVPGRVSFSLRASLAPRLLRWRRVDSTPPLQEPGNKVDYIHPGGLGSVYRVLGSRFCVQGSGF